MTQPNSNNLCGINGKCQATNKDERATCKFALDEFGGFDGCMYLAWDFATCCSDFALAAAKIAQEDARCASKI